MRKAKGLCKRAAASAYYYSIPVWHTACAPADSCAPSLAAWHPRSHHPPQGYGCAHADPAPRPASWSPRRPGGQGARTRERSLSHRCSEYGCRGNQERGDSPVTVGQQVRRGLTRLRGAVGAQHGIRLWRCHGSKRDPLGGQVTGGRCELPHFKTASPATIVASQSARQVSVERASRMIPSTRAAFS